MIKHRKGDREYEPSLIVPCYINEVCLRVWREAQRESWRDSRERGGEEGEKAKGFLLSGQRLRGSLGQDSNAPTGPSANVQVLENSQFCSFPRSSFCSCGLESYPLCEPSLPCSVSGRSAEGQCDLQEKSQTRGCARSQLWVLSKPPAQYGSIF